MFYSILSGFYIVDTVCNISYHPQNGGQRYKTTCDDEEDLEEPIDQSNYDSEREYDPPSYHRNIMGGGGHDEYDNSRYPPQPAATASKQPPQRRATITKQATIPERDVERGQQPDIDLERPPGPAPDYSVAEHHQQPWAYQYPPPPPAPTDYSRAATQQQQQQGHIIPSLPPGQQRSPQRPKQSYTNHPRGAGMPPGEHGGIPRTPVDPMVHMLPPRPPQVATTSTETDPRLVGGSAPSAGTGRKLPQIPRGYVRAGVRPTIPCEPHYPSSFHASFDEGGEASTVVGNVVGSELCPPPYGSNPHLSATAGSGPTIAGGGGPSPHTVYESYHQQFRQLKRQQTSPMGSARQLPMAPFGHRRTASSSSFGGYHEQPTDLMSPG